MDLGRKIKSPGSEPISPAGKEEPKISYPGVNFNDEAATNFLKENECDLGDELTATVKLKVTSLRKDEYGNSVGFDVLSIDDVKADGGDEDEAGSADEEKALGYKRPKAGAKKEVPGLSAKDLTE